jgi:hypothetical protein
MALPKPGRTIKLAFQICFRSAHDSLTTFRDHIHTVPGFCAS